MTFSNSQRIRTPDRRRSVLRIGISPLETPNSHYPQTPLPNLPMGKLALDSLFFIFYHQAGSYAQYSVALELQNQGWMYHRKYQTWFKPNANGAYWYFDYESSWSLKAKPGFVFDPAMQEEIVE